MSMSGVDNGRTPGAINQEEEKKPMENILSRHTQEHFNMHSNITMPQAHHYFIWKMTGQWGPLPSKEGGMIRNESNPN